MVLQSGLEALRTFDPEQHWLSFERRYVLERRSYLDIPVIVEKPEGLWGWLVRVFYEYVYKPEKYQLFYVVPNVHQFIDLAEDLAGQELGFVNREDLHNTARRIYLYFSEKTFHRRDLIRERPDVFPHLLQFAEQHNRSSEAQVIESVFPHQPPQELYHSEIQRIAMSYRRGKSANTIIAVDILLNFLPQKVIELPHVQRMQREMTEKLVKFVEPNFDQLNRSLTFANMELYPLCIFKMKYRKVLSFIQHFTNKLRSNQTISQQERVVMKMLSVLVSHFFFVKKNLLQSAATSESIEAYKQDLISFLIELVDVFDTCADRRDSGLENIYYKYALPPSARNRRVEEKVFQLLERQRKFIRDTVISKLLVGGIDHSSTIHYWQRNEKIRCALGIKESIATLSRGLEGFAYKPEHMEKIIIESFWQEYTPEAIIGFVSEHVMGQGDILSASQFEAWVLENLCRNHQSALEACYRQDGKWKADVIAEALTRFGVLEKVL